MTRRDIFVDLSHLARPVATKAELEASDIPEDVHTDIRQDQEESRLQYEENLRQAWDANDDFDPLLNEIAGARREMLDAERRMRELIAYGREFIEPRPYRLEDLARAAGMSISGVRTAYDDDEIDAVAQATGAKRRRRGTDQGQ